MEQARSYRSWDALRAACDAAVEPMSEQDFLVVGEPQAEAPAKAGGLRGMLSRRPTPPPTRFVQALRVGDRLGAECVGAASFGGPYDFDAATDQRLRALGWLAPGDAGYDDMGGPAYRLWLPFAERDRFGTLAVASFQAMGLSAAGPWEISRG
jgi:hypothetical protein